MKGILVHRKVSEGPNFRIANSLCNAFPVTSLQKAAFVSLYGNISVSDVSSRARKRRKKAEKGRTMLSASCGCCGVSLA